MSKFTDSNLSRSDGIFGFEAGGGGGGASPFSRPKENKTLVSALLIGRAVPFYHCEEEFTSEAIFTLTKKKEQQQQDKHTDNQSIVYVPFFTEASKKTPFLFFFSFCCFCFSKEVWSL